MSDGGEVWISPNYFFYVVGTMRTQTALGETTSTLTVPTTGITAGGASLEALTLAVDEARTMYAASMEVAGRALTIAGTQVTSADMVEEDVSHVDGLPAPHQWDFTQSAEEREVIQQRYDAYAADLQDFLDATPAEEG
ncbi:MAG: hypothetical protein ACK5OX_14390 [Desertimonas sp.]